MGRGEGRLRLTVLTWNLFHGRDHPPGGIRGGAAWRLLGRPSRLGDHALLNRDLGREFSARLASWEWDVALLQEVPPPWVARLAREAGATACFSLTSRNWMSPVTGPVWAARPHLAGSWEGGSNAILVRPGGVLEAGSRGRATLTLLPERRRLSWVGLAGGPMLFCLHASTGPGRAARDTERAARIASSRSSGRPAVFGGDLNVSPARDPSLFQLLEKRFGLHLPREAPRGSIDQVLVAGAKEAASVRVPAVERDFRDDRTGLLGRLSDHDPVIARVLF